jgi:glycosyltransferase involved in cell wall biosynthesis
MPRFSVIIPTFNRMEMCRAAVDSVLRQDLGDFELIVVDDGSTDGTLEAMMRYGDRVRLLHQENKGQSVARNLAIGAAQGQYVAFLDSDDQWFPWTLATLDRAVREGNQPAIIAGRSVPFSRQPPTPDSIDQSYDMDCFDDVLDCFARSGAVVFETGVLVIRTDILKAAGGFSPTRDNAEDVDLCLRLGTAPGFVRLQSPPLFAKLNHTSNIGLQSDLSTNGLREIHRRERAGIYPGGASRERARLALILVASRQTILEAVYWRKLGLAWSLYRRCFFWNLRLGEWKFAFKLPPLVMFGYCRKYLADYLSLLRGMVRLHTLERRA